VIVSERSKKEAGLIWQIVCDPKLGGGQTIVKIGKEVSRIRHEAVNEERDRCKNAALTLRYYINNPSAWKHFDQQMSDNIEYCLRAIDPSLLKEI
jgi:hypothetical protein